jgi:hypothetical protein
MKLYRRLLIITSIAALGALVACGAGGGDDEDVGEDVVVSLAAIPGVAAPALGDIPAAKITATTQYTGRVTWDGDWAWSSRFGGNKAYAATITLTAKAGYTLTKIAANFFTVAGATAVSNGAGSGVVTAIFPATATVAIGDGALGGQVAYILMNGDPGYVDGEQRGLIAATDDRSPGIIWAVAACQSTAVPGGTGTALGTGSVNTDLLISQNGAGADYAAGNARGDRSGGYTDWFLPSKDELNKIFLSKAVLLNLSAGDYWCSSEYNSTRARYQNMGIGNYNNDSKSGACRVRAVRYF